VFPLLLLYPPIVCASVVRPSANQNSWLPTDQVEHGAGARHRRCRSKPKEQLPPKISEKVARRAMVAASCARRRKASFIVAATMSRSFFIASMLASIESSSRQVGATGSRAITTITPLLSILNESPITLARQCYTSAT
jgi:hypothetical protein